MEEKETIHINLLTELTGNLISEESEWEEEWTENDAYGMPLDGTDLAWYESAIREELNRYGEDDLMEICYQEEHFNREWRCRRKREKIIPDQQKYCFSSI